MNTTTLTHDIISSDRVEGTSVYDEAGEKLGSIDETHSPIQITR